MRKIPSADTQLTHDGAGIDGGTEIMAMDHIMGRLSVLQLYTFSVPWNARICKSRINMQKKPRSAQVFVLQAEIDDV